MTKHYSRKVWTLIVIAAVIAAGAAVCTFAFHKQEPPKPHVRHRPGKKVLQNLLENMVRVEGGAYVMGATAEQGSDAFESEKPGHMVEVKSFYICRFEVTQAEWEVVMGYNPSGFKSEQHPVENVSWEDCQRFISKLSAITGRLFRLPTEVEWEYAARGGKLSCGYKYSGGNEIDSLAWYEENSERHSHLIGQKEPNELGTVRYVGQCMGMVSGCLCAISVGHRRTAHVDSANGQLPRAARRKLVQRCARLPSELPQLLHARPPRGKPWLQACHIAARQPGALPIAKWK